MKQNIFSKVWNKLFRKKTRRATLAWEPYSEGHFSDKGSQMPGPHISPENFRRLFSEAYPDGAKFLDSIEKRMDEPSGREFFFTKEGLVSDKFLSANEIAPKTLRR